MKRNNNASPLILTIGHSTRSLEAFTDLLWANSVTRVVDVRTVPRSRHNPQFNRETLPDVLRTFGIDYIHMPGLGGLRHPQANSPNLTNWRLFLCGHPDMVKSAKKHAFLSGASMKDIYADAFTVNLAA